MNTAQVLKTLQDAGITTQVAGFNLKIRHQTPLTNELLKYLRQHKQEIIEYLTSSNQSRYHGRYIYKFILKNNQGGGTYITDSPPNNAEQELIDRFIGREIESMDLLN